jgi:hypothetical protein
MGVNAMRNAFMFLLLMVTSVAWGQSIQHAPTEEQCRADLRLWWAEDKATISSLPAYTLQGRIVEMGHCVQVLPGNTESLNAISEVDIYDSHLQRRLFNFLTRHNQMQQFVKEDSAGAR